MIDAQARRIAYLRLSLTAACQMRCAYCRPRRLQVCDQETELGAAELRTIVRHLVVERGVRKVRLTGGDPTARGDLIEIIRSIADIEGVHDLAMTTNGLTLARDAARLRDAGLHRVNVSLDSLDPRRFAHLTGVDALPRVIAGIDAAIEAQLTPLKINTVVLRGENEDQLPDLVRFAAARGVEIRFIELMPMGPLAGEWQERYVPASEMRARLEEVVVRWDPLPQGSDSARVERAVLRGGSEVEVGFITPMSCNFCAACDRLRLTSDGFVYPCLMDEPRGSFLPALRPRFDAALFDRIISEALKKKAPQHPAQGVAVMTTIGG